MNTTTYQQALARYHAAYDNAIYTNIRRLILTQSTTDDEHVTDFMNSLIDACLECCGSPRHSGAHIRLARLAAQLNLDDVIIDVIYQYLLTFQQARCTTADDFEAITKALIRACPGRSRIGEAVAHANGIHSWRGRAAYHLLAAAEDLMKSAQLLLQHHEDEVYIQEKLKRGMGRITMALREGQQHSHHATLFDFNE